MGRRIGSRCLRSKMTIQPICRMANWLNCATGGAAKKKCLFADYLGIGRKPVGLGFVEELGRGRRGHGFSGAFNAGVVAHVQQVSAGPTGAESAHAVGLELAVIEPVAPGLPLQPGGLGAYLGVDGLQVRGQAIRMNSAEPSRKAYLLVRRYRLLLRHWQKESTCRSPSFLKI